VVLETYRRLQAEDPLTERALEQMLVGVSTRKYARSLEPTPAGLTETGTSKSAVSRRFVAKTQEQLEAALSQPLGDRGWLALLIDGFAFHRDEEPHRELEQGHPPAERPRGPVPQRRDGAPLGG